MQLYLASASPRRLELLTQAGLSPVVCPADIDERRLPHESPIKLVQRLARQKAHAALALLGPLSGEQALVAADTIVWLDDEVLGKPRDEEDALRMLGMLSGRTHCVSTGVCALLGTSGASPQEQLFVDTTEVTFHKLSEDQIAAYVATGEPMDKAGAYGIQGGAGTFVAALQGDYDNVVGLPVNHMLQVLGQHESHRGSLS